MGSIMGWGGGGQMTCKVTAHSSIADHMHTRFTLTHKCVYQRSHRSHAFCFERVGSHSRYCGIDSSAEESGLGVSEPTWSGNRLSRDWNRLLGSGFQNRVESGTRRSLPSLMCRHTFFSIVIIEKLSAFFFLAIIFQFLKI